MTNHNGPPRDDFDSIVAGLDHAELAEPTLLEQYFDTVDDLEAVVAKNLHRRQKFSPEGIIEVDRELFEAAARFSDVVSEVSDQSDRLETAADLLQETLARIRALYSRITGETDLSQIDTRNLIEATLRKLVAEFQHMGDSNPYMRAYLAVLKDEISVFPQGHTSQIEE